VPTVEVYSNQAVTAGTQKTGRATATATLEPKSERRKSGEGPGEGADAGLTMNCPVG
jgi:hypothetical protein